jgi:hypothetical protein
MVPRAASSPRRRSSRVGDCSAVGVCSPGTSVPSGLVAAVALFYLPLVTAGG